jgi:hypothetical protein
MPETMGAAIEVNSSPPGISSTWIGDHETTSPAAVGVLAFPHQSALPDEVTASVPHEKAEAMTTLSLSVVTATGVSRSWFVPSPNSP